jgi:hypothetical protein
MEIKFCNIETAQKKGEKDLNDTGKVDEEGTANLWQ